MNKNGNDLHSALSIFTDKLDAADYISAKIQAQVSSSLIKYRLQNHLSQKEFANRLGVSQGLVSRWESSDYNFTIDKLADIATKLNMDLNITFNTPKKRFVDNQPTINSFNTFKLQSDSCDSWGVQNNMYTVKTQEVL